MGGVELKLDPEMVRAYYSREDIQERIYEAAQDKEIAIKYSYGFGKRPDMISYVADVYELVKKGATSFHFSEELWNNPLQLSPAFSLADLDKNRMGWDLIIDIDTPVFVYSRLAAHLIVEILKYHGVEGISVKFSGNHGFHIGVAFESFPTVWQGKPTAMLFPEAPRRIAEYMKDRIEKHLRKQLLELHSISKIIELTGKSRDDVIKGGQLDPFEVVDVDTVLISSRHLCRMPYSFNEKSGLISVPIRADEILTFNRDDAHPSKVDGSITYMDRSVVRAGEATELLQQAYDWSPKLAVEKKRKKIDFTKLKEAAGMELFPPCITTILGGLEDGKKRAVFILLNFLWQAGWDGEVIEAFVHDWNKKNPEPLREAYLTGQIRHFLQSDKILPPNCSNEAYYAGLRICEPDNFCRKIKNPANYTRLRVKIMEEEKAKTSKKVSDKKTDVSPSSPEIAQSEGIEAQGEHL